MPIRDRFFVRLSSLMQSETKKAWTLGVWDVVHATWLSSAEHRSPAACLEYITEQRVSGPHSAEVRSDFDELSAV